MTLLSIDDGERLDYFLGLAKALPQMMQQLGEDITLREAGKVAGNW